MLNRREVKVLFRGAAGKINRNEAAEKIANQLSVNKKQVIPINLRCQTGMIDVHAILYVYDDENEAARQLPRYRLLRTLSREERKKRLPSLKLSRKLLLQRVVLLEVPRGNGGQKGSR